VTEGIKSSHASEANRQPVDASVPQGTANTARASVSGRPERKPLIPWAALLDEAVKKPGFIHEAYSRFHDISQDETAPLEPWLRLRADGCRLPNDWGPGGGPISVFCRVPISCWRAFIENGSRPLSFCP
jgi:hypothetical protein